MSNYSPQANPDGHVILPAVVNSRDTDRSGHTILLGGVGGDSHSVGLTILRQALSANGYQVCYLGTHNALEDFFVRAALCDVVMISSLDGHTRYYLREFPELMKKYQAQKSLWYLGGNLHVGDAYGYEKYFREMGFDRVFVKFVDIVTVLQTLESDLQGVEALSGGSTILEQGLPVKFYFPTPVSDEQLEEESLQRSRREVLQSWRTGHQAQCLEANAEFLGRQHSFPGIQATTQMGRSSMLLQPRSGVPLLDEQIRHFHAFKNVGAHVLSYQIDSLTRNNNYAGAEEAIRESRATGVATINGFPAVNHGVPGLKRVISEVKMPLQVRHSTRDPRLLAEISFAGGVTAFEGGPICYNIPYYKDYPPDESVRVWQYVDRLTGLYHERFGIALDREFFGTLTATLIPPCLALATDIIEAILAIRQGVKCVSLGYAEQGHRIQDIAAIRTLRRMAREIVGHLGYKDVQINTVFHQYMAAFPDTPRRAEDLIYNSAITASLSGATRVILKTPAEAYKIPTLEDNLEGLALAKRATSALPVESCDEARIDEECDIIRREVQAILDSVILCGKGSIAEGTVAALKKGYIDIPFAPSIHIRGEVMTARDVEGAVRFLSTGHLQFEPEVRDFHHAKMTERRRAEGLVSTKQDYLLVEKDVLRIPRGQYACWPLFG